ncbi:MAG: 6,7-dimethyl-8-ribityllumazine synthase [Pseudomonadota bacterium]
MKPPRPTRRPLPRAAVRSVAVLVSRYHEEITACLADGAERVLKKAGVSRIDKFQVPGAYELPQAAQAAVANGGYDAVVALGCIVRGETPHFEYIAQAVANGLDEVGRRSGTAVAFGVLTVDRIEQAFERAGGRAGNKGEEAASAALELAGLLRRMRNGKPPKSA